MATTHSTDHSSADDIDDDITTPAEEHWHDSPEHGQNFSPSMGSSPGSAQPNKASAPAQKRRRVTRACDECRRKKIKCDGKQPCTHCTVYSYDCTYDQPSNRRRNPAPQYIEALEARLHRAEALLRTVLPDVDLNDPSLDLTTPQRIIPHFKRDPAKGTSGGSMGAALAKTTTGGESGDELLESMVDNTGSLDLDDQGHWDYHGQSSGLMFLRRMREQFSELFGQELYRGTAQFLGPRPTSQFFDSPRSSDSPTDILAHTHDLPTREIAKELCSNALVDACTLMRFVHLPSFFAMLDRIYDTPPEQHGNDENRFLPLLYVVMALGCLFAKTEQSKLVLKDGYEGATDQGFQYFRAGRQLMDITDCRDLQSLQAVVFMILFLQSSARLSTCYSYIGIALRSSLRMGLHRKVSVKFDPIERETRKRVFWIIRKMDVYVGALLGLPQMLSDDDIDQEDPIEVDDEFITAQEIKAMPQGRISFLAGANAHTRLVRILQKIVRYIYPIRGLHANRPKSEQSYVVSHAKIREIERDLQVWMESLPMALRPGDDTPPEMVRLQHLLRMSYAHVQMMLYRPFLHYVTNACGQKVDKRSYACAAACVSISRNIVHITTEMKKRGLLIGSYWFAMYTTFFAILSLVFFVLENPGSATGEDIFKDAREGKDTLASLAKRSMAADRCSQTLAGLFSELPDRLTRGHQLSSQHPKKKRAHPSLDIATANTAARSNPDVSRVSQSDNFNSPQRASTFPSHPNSAGNTPKPAFANSPSVPLTSVDDNQLPGSREPWTPNEGTFTPDSIPGFMLSQAQVQNSPRNSTFNPQTAPNTFPDLSSVMFPSGDPFAYPNQPISALEEGNFKQEPGPFGLSGASNIFSSFNEPTTTGIPFENFDAPIYAAPFVMQAGGQGQGQGQGQMGNPAGFQSPMDWSGSGSGSEMGGGEGQAGWQQGKTNGVNMNMNLNQILRGEEWPSGWLEAQYRQ